MIIIDILINKILHNNNDYNFSNENNIYRAVVKVWKNWPMSSVQQNGMRKNERNQSNESAFCTNDFYLLNDFTYLLILYIEFFNFPVVSLG